MRDCRFSPAAIADIDGIWDYTAEHWNPDQTDRYTDEIRDACRDLARGTKIGRSALPRRTHLKYNISAHVIYFRMHDDRIEIIRVLHSGMDANRHL